MHCKHKHPKHRHNHAKGHTPQIQVKKMQHGSVSELYLVTLITLKTMCHSEYQAVNQTLGGFHATRQKHRVRDIHRGQESNNYIKNRGRQRWIDRKMEVKRRQVERENHRETATNTLRWKTDWGVIAPTVGWKYCVAASRVSRLKWDFNPSFFSKKCIYLLHTIWHHLPSLNSPHCPFSPTSLQGSSCSFVES